MSIEIRNLSISSSVIERAAREPGEEAQALPAARMDETLRAECRRMIVELLDAREER